MANRTISDQKRLCRLCFTNQDQLYSIFDDEMPELAERIYDCTTVEINNIDGIPALICQQCRAKVVISCNYFGSWRNAVQKYRQLLESQVQQHELKRSIGSVEYKPSMLVINQSPPNVSNQDVTNGFIPAKPSVLDHLRNDDKVRRNSIDEYRKDDIKYVTKNRLSEASNVANTSMELLAVKIEQSIRNDADQKAADDGEQSFLKCDLLVQDLQKHKHSAEHTSVGKHVCGICNKTFTKRFLLNYHINVHTGDRPFKCPECGKGFASPTTLWKHKQIHSGVASLIRTADQRFHCNVCNCVFKHRKLINKHMRMTHRERKFPCETCGKAYFTRDDLRKHMTRIHQQKG